MSCLKATTLLLIVLTTIFSIVGLATNYWLKNGDDHQGLYHYCLDANDDCKEFDEDPVINVNGMPGRYQLINCY